MRNRNIDYELKLLKSRVGTLFDLIDRQKNQLLPLVDEEPIYFTYTDDEYGEMAKEWHKKNGTPRYAYDGDAGFDLPIMLSKEDHKHGHRVIWPGERDLLHTGLRLQFPLGKFGRITHRSSTEKRHRLRIVEGTIDNAFRGPILIQVHNTNACQLNVYHGNRYAQLIICQIYRHQIKFKRKLNDTVRSTKGFGSSGT